MKQLKLEVALLAKALELKDKELTLLAAEMLTKRLDELTIFKRLFQLDDKDKTLL